MGHFARFIHDFHLKNHKKIVTLKPQKNNIYSIGTLEVTFFYRQPLVVSLRKGLHKASPHKANSKVYPDFATAKRSCTA